MSFLNRVARAATSVLFAGVLAACGNSEADQRKAFIGFLQDINGRSGVHFLLPTADDEKAFGPYLQHYTIIIDFNKDMEVATNDFTNRIMQFGFGPAPTPRTIEQMAARPQDLPAAKDIVDGMVRTIEARVAQLNVARNALVQPDDLKSVYDKTFDKLVTAPTSALEKSEKTLDEGIDASVKLAAYINSHRNRLTVSGMRIEAKDQRTLDEVGPLLKAHDEASERFAAARRDGQRILDGN
ncbi:MAG TPA: DUF3053 family protein [Xanthobacteraceae bacterium]|jgi:hypothetical protein|nr:DUF3053 family protein [Xanthobacteraceae bacterium]